MYLAFKTYHLWFVLLQQLQVLLTTQLAISHCTGVTATQSSVHQCCEGPQDQANDGEDVGKALSVAHQGDHVGDDGESSEDYADSGGVVPGGRWNQGRPDQQEIPEMKVTSHHLNYLFVTVLVGQIY